MPKVNANGINIYYELHGEGSPLIMILGFSGNSSWWDPHQIERLPRRFKTIVLDNRGSWRTDAPKVDYSMKMFADDAACLMDALKIKKDIILPPENAKILAERIPRAKLVILENHPHAILYEDPDVVIDTIIEFLT